MPRVRYSKTKGLYSETGSHEGVCLRSNSTVIAASPSGNQSISTNDGDHTVLINVALADGDDIILPQATVNNIGARVRVVVGVDCAASGTIRIGFLNGGSTVMKGALHLQSVNATGTTKDSVGVLASAKTITLDDDSAANAGGAAGSYYDFYYTAANVVLLTGHGCTNHGTPALVASTAFSATGPT
jgi:hypothetical protein